MANLISVMVVDDDPVSSAQLGALAKAAGYDVQTVKTDAKRGSCFSWRACPS